jgi:site-specific DNA recombinase
MKVIIYGRVSTYSQDYNSQLERLKTYCGAFNYEIVEIFHEKVSGVKERKDRKEISRLVTYLDENTDVRGVLVSELTRLGRNSIDVLKLIEEITKKNVWIYSLKENIHTFNPDGTKSSTGALMLNILTGIAEHERETTLYRSIAGLQHSTGVLNRWVGGVFLPYGYQREDKKLVIDEKQAEVVKQIFNLYLEGNGVQRIANELNRLKIPTRYNLSLHKDSIKINNKLKKKEDFNWKDGTIYSILTNPVYIGEKMGTRKLEGIKLSSPSIIDKDVFEAVQTGLKSKQIKRTTKFFYLFQNKFYCGCCERTYYPHKRTPKDENKVSKDSRYVCLSKRYKEPCENYGIGISKVNDGVWSVLRNNKREIENILNLNSDGVKNIEEQINVLTKDIEQVQKEIKSLEGSEKKLVDLLLSDEIDKGIYTSKYNEITKKKTYSSSKLLDLKDELRTKLLFKNKQSSINFQLRTIKDNKRILKKVIDEVVNKLIIYPVKEHNLSNYRKFTKMDKFVFIEIYTYLNESVPLIFVVSQRSDVIITPKQNEFNKDTFELKIGGFVNNDDELEEEEGSDISIMKLYHLTSLD